MTELLASTANLNAGILSTIGTFALAILVLLFMITVHEFGHYIVAKIFDFKVNEFAIGMGPAIFKKKKKNGEIFSIRILPLGGFCAFEGEDEENTDPRAFNNKKPWQRILVLIAGATMNFISAVLIFVISISCYGQMCLQSFEIANPTEYTLQSEDVLLSLNGKTIYLTTDITTALKDKRKGDSVTAEIVRDGKRQTISIILSADPVSNNLQDLNGIYESLSIAQLFGVSQTSNLGEKVLNEGDYVLRISKTLPVLLNGELANSNDYTDVKVYDEESKTFVLYAIDNATYLSESRAYTTATFCDLVREFNDGDKMYMYVSRGSDRLLLSYELNGLTDAIKESDDAILNYFGIGGTVSGYRMYSQNVKFGFFESIGRGVTYAFKTVTSTLTAFWQLITGKLGLDALGGPVTTITMTAQVASYGFNYLLEMAGLIGVSLAVFNLLPIPALDGARAVFVAIEWIRKKPVNQKVEGTIHAVGLILLLIFAVSVDLIKCF